MFRRYLDFGSRHASFVERNTLITDALGGSSKWVLDIGSNLGETSNFLSDAGHYVVGVEKFAKEHQIACKRSSENVAFMRASITPELILSGPEWDAGLLLSVLHRIYAFEGEAFMRLILNAAGKKTKQLFVEGSTRHKRYMDGGHPAPDFVDFDIEDATRWHVELLAKELGKAWDVSDCIVLKHSKNEPHRLFFHCVRKQQ